MLKSLRHLIWVLLPFGAIHLFIVYLRNKLYDWKIFKSKQLAKPVISIGNLQIGGTGKTPLAISMLRNLQKREIKVGVLSRGYKRKSDEIVIISPERAGDRNIYHAIGDEPSIFLKELKGGVLGIGADRYQVGKKMLEQHPVDLFLLDDGLQHRKFDRNVDICLIDVSRWNDHPFLFPFSYLRDCKSSLKRCQMVILSKINDLGKARKLRNQIEDRYGIPVLEGDLEPKAFINLRNGTEIGFSELKGQKAAAFCGIANPDHFFDMLKPSGLDLVFEKRYADHYEYSPSDLMQFERIMTAKEVNIAITTEKDAVKLNNLIQQHGAKFNEYFFLRVEFKFREANTLDKIMSDMLPS